MKKNHRKGHYAVCPKVYITFLVGLRRRDPRGEREVQGGVFIKSSTRKELKTWLHGPLLGCQISHKFGEVICHLLCRTYVNSVILIWESHSSTSFSSDISVIRMGQTTDIMRHHLDRVTLLKRQCTYNSLEDLVKMPI